MNRREAVRTLGGLGLGALLAGATGRTDGGAQQPNVIFIMTDDHATNALSCYGGTLMPTPNLDRIAEEGVRFDNCFVTNSLCAPSRATILTGKYSHVNGHTENGPVFDGSQQTFPKLLRQAGYRTGHIGKWHLRSEPTGFDYYNRLPGQGRYFNPAFIENGEQRQYDGYVTDIITDHTIDLIDRWKDEEEPFFITSWHKAPHRGWQPDAEHDDLFEGVDLPLPETFYDDYQGRSSAAAHADMRIAQMPDYGAPRDLPPEEQAAHKYQQYIKDYLGTIASVDDNVGRLLDYLDETGLAENTIVVYTSDNGFFLGEHGWFDKRFMYEESLRIPLMVRYPAEVPAGAAVDHSVLNLDFAQTFLDYAGATSPGDMQGRSLRPLLDGEHVPDWRQSVYYHYYEYPGPHDVRPHYGARTDRYKLVYYYTIDEWELFDLERDPLELNSVHDDPAYRGVFDQLFDELHRLRLYYDDTTGEPLPVGVEPRAEPDVVTVHPPAPNPFHASTDVMLEMPQPADVQAEVFDVLGRRVAVLHDGHLSQGRHRLHWDGGASAGLYVCRVRAGDVVRTVRMVQVE